MLGSKCTSIMEEDTNVVGKPSIIPSIEGCAKIYGFNTISIDPADDPYAYGCHVL